MRLLGTSLVNQTLSIYESYMPSVDYQELSSALQFMSYLLDTIKPSIWVILSLPSKPRIQNWDPDHDQSITNDALDRSAMVPG